MYISVLLVVLIISVPAISLLGYMYFSGQSIGWIEVGGGISLILFLSGWLVSLFDALKGEGE